METPTRNFYARPTRNPTPKLSERKKKLFEVQRLEEEDDTDLLRGIQPLAAKSSEQQITPKRQKSINALLTGSARKSISFFESADTDESSEQELNVKRTPITAIRRSPRLRQHSTSSSSPETNKENRNRRTPARVNNVEDEQLPNLFSASMRINGQDNKRKKSAVNDVRKSVSISNASTTPRSTRRVQTFIDETLSSESEDEKTLKQKSTKLIHSDKRQPMSPVVGDKGRSKAKEIIIDETSSSESDDADDASLKKKPSKCKRQHVSIDFDEEIPSPERKIRKTDELSIPTRAFYSSKSNNTSTQIKLSPNSTRNSTKSKTGFSRRPQSSKKKPFNKVVRHNIRKPIMASHGMQHLPPLDVDRILGQMRNEKLRKLIASKREEREQIEKIHNIFRYAKDPIKMAKPLSVFKQAGSSGVVAERNDNNNNSNNNIGECEPNKERILTVRAQQNHDAADFSDIEPDDDESDREDCEEDDAKIVEDEPIIPLIRHNEVVDPLTSLNSEEPQTTTTTSSNRKFFKSGRRNSTHMEVRITDNIRASVCNGKISLVQQKPPKTRRLKVKSTATNAFSMEQATVDAILKNLDDTAFGDVIEADMDTTSVRTSEADIEDECQVINNEAVFTINNANDVATAAVNTCDDFDNFRCRLPYNTSDPDVIEQQSLLLDFLITNDICTEENFNIFIADPDNPDNKDAAARIVDEIVLVVTGTQEHSFRQRLPYNTTDPALIEQQEFLVDMLIKNNMCTEENFDICIANFESRQTEALALLEKLENAGALTAQLNEEFESVPAVEEEMQVDNIGVSNVHEAAVIEEITNVNSPATKTIEPDAQQPKLFPIFTAAVPMPLVQKPSTRLKPTTATARSWVGGDGANQMQLDIGQKRFGAIRCSQCGLVYTAHEPEEEKLHRNYHASVHVLRFQGWIDEDIVAVYPEWANNGRILRLTENSNIRRRERLNAILDIVDKELGYSRYKLPGTFVAFIATRNSKIIGICVVEPLSKARRYMHLDGNDYGSSEEYDVKCGVSRIWVCPRERRTGIATKLIKAVQQNTIRGEDISIMQIAFSAPTDEGKLLAQKLCKPEQFLVYQ